MKKLNKKGFTIVELVIVIAVIAILAGVLIPTFATVVDKANQSKAMQEAKNEYEAYLAENAAALTGTENFYVIVDNKYAFEVTNGQFNTTKLDTVPTIAEDKKVDQSKVYVKAENGAFNYVNGVYVKATGNNGAYNAATDADGKTDIGSDKIVIYAK